MNKYLRLVTFALLLPNCMGSYFGSGRCNGIDWYDYGYKVALAGKGLARDLGTIRCFPVNDMATHRRIVIGWQKGLKVYCSEKGSFSAGRRGRSHNASLCKESLPKSFASAHSRGLRVFCRPEEAHEFGTSGNVYTGVCSPTEEITWLPEYRRGRIEYLMSEINDQKMIMAANYVQFQKMQRVHVETERNRKRTSGNEIVNTLPDPAIYFHRRKNEIRRNIQLMQNEIVRMRRR